MKNLLDIDFLSYFDAFFKKQQSSFFHHIAATGAVESCGTQISCSYEVKTS